MASLLDAPRDRTISSAHDVILELVSLSTGGDGDHEATIQALLHRVQTYFDLPLAIVSRIEGPKYSVEYVIDVAGELKPGAEFDFSATYCERVIALAQPLLIHDVSTSLLKDHPCYRELKLETYAGVRLFSGGKVYGTLNLSGPERRKTAFTTLDFSVLETAGALIGHHISIREADERFEAAVRGSNVGLWDWDVRTDEVYWSPRYLEILGLEEGFRATFDDFAARLHEDDRDRVMLAVNDHLSLRKPLSVEYRMQHASGEYLWVLARGQAIWGRDDTPVRMAGSIEDVTSRHAAEDALRLSEERFQLAIDAANAGIWDWDLASEQHHWSRRYFDLLGLKPGEIEPSREAFASLVHPEDLPAIDAAMRRHIKTREPLRVRHRMRHADGHWVHVRSRGQAIWDENGRAIRVAGSVEDISNRVRAEQQLREQAEELQRTNAELERYAFVASHDLQEPLRKIAAFGEMLQRGYADKLDDRGRNIVEVMIDGATRMQQLIRDLLRYSKSSNAEMDIQPVDVAALIDDVERDLEMAIEESGASIVRRDLPVVRGDPVLLRQLFQNLVGNSIRYCGDTEPYVELSSEHVERDGSAFWQIAVKDRGIGFSPEHAEKIFEIFQRLHSRTEYPGTGIGLALCHRIVERHGGVIRADGKPGEGACFHIELPAAAEN